MIKFLRLALLCLALQIWFSVPFAKGQDEEKQDDEAQAQAQAEAESMSEEGIVKTEKDPDVVESKEADVPLIKSELTEEEAQALERWSGKNPKLGFEEDDEDGNYYYKSSDATSEKEVNDDLKIVAKPDNYKHGLNKVMSDGSYLFNVDETPSTRAISIRFGQLRAPVLKNKTTDVKYSDIYSSKALSATFFDYAWQVQKFGKWGLTLGSGISSSSAPGRFKSTPDAIAIERYTIYIFPNHLSLSYSFQYTPHPFIVPYVSGGYSHIGIMESRDDSKARKLVAAKAIQTSGGIRLNLGVIDSHGAFSLNSEYGINNVWIDVQMKIIKGLDADRDFSSDVANAGFAFDF